MSAILVVEDDRTFARILEGFLGKLGHTVLKADTGEEGYRLFLNSTCNLVLLDFRLPDATGYELLVKMKSEKPDVPVILMTSFSDIRTAVKAIKAGAFEYVTKPVNPDELQLLIRQALEKRPQTVATKSSSDQNFIRGNSPVSVQLYEYISVVAPTDLTVVLEGESGTGKEYVARTIHQLSRRKDGSFVAVDCGALSKELAGSELFGHVKGAFTGAVSTKIGQFEAAKGGTLFLDEVGNLSYEVQVKLLRAIQERIIQPLGSTRDVKTDVRILTATNENLTDQIQNGNFREDLYYRLNEFKIQVPPLRTRGEDIDLFIEFFREEANRELSRTAETFAPAVLELFHNYDWPGNLRELRNIIRRAVLLTRETEIKMDVLPQDFVIAVRTSKLESSLHDKHDLKALQERQERELIVRTLEEVRYNKAKAARLLNIDRKTLYLKMEKYGIQ
ncbi:MAG: sigma-54-dependent Fis family transcriptional regulator [Cyclobacteriaceae bacterium]|nr:sigma-54-dependent Fis family transcriptional regulator [Cyclobacteriaceae bacterium]